jgi:hypothetical protein
VGLGSALFSRPTWVKAPLFGLVFVLFLLALPEKANAAAPVCSAKQGSSGVRVTLCISDYPRTLDNSRGLASPTGFYAATVTVTERASSTVLGCPGQRLSPSLCVTWTVNGAYSLTNLYSPFRFRLYPMFQPAGQKTVTAVSYVDGAALSVSVPLTVTGSATPSTPSPNSGKRPGVRPASAKAVKIAAVGDAPAGQTSARAVANLVASWKPDMLFYLGDLYQSGSYQEFLNYWHPSTTFGRFNSIAAPTPGNHEYNRWSNGAPYFWYWNYRNGAPSSTQGGQYYSFNVGGWHIISLNSEVPHDASSAQLAWLRNDLARHPSALYPCTIALWHKPRYSTAQIGARESIKAFWDVMVPARVDIFLNAHSHVYERTRTLKSDGNISRNGVGVRQFVVGTGGNLTDVWRLDATTERIAYRSNLEYGALRLTLRPGEADFAFVTVRGRTLDSGRVACGCSSSGTSGRDVIEGTPGNDVICGLGGNDVILGRGGNDVLYGTDGNDRLIGGPGEDRLVAGWGNDFLAPGPGNDRLDGGRGTDTVSFAGAGSRVTVDLAEGTASGQGSERLSALENVTGSPYSDRLWGSGVRNVLRALGGADRLFGRAGSDYLSGGRGNDRLNGGSGNDRCVQGPGTGARISC